MATFRRGALPGLSGNLKLFIRCHPSLFERQAAIVLRLAVNLANYSLTVNPSNV